MLSHQQGMTRLTLKDLARLIGLDLNLLDISLAEATMWCVTTLVAATTWLEIV